MVTITLNGRAVEAPEGVTVLEAATAAGVQIPTLCYLKDLNCIGSCRVCLVDVEGEGLVASCNTAVREGMVVRTDTPQVAAARRANLQAIMDDHRALCATCVRQDTCALRDLASTFNLTDAPGPLPEPAPWDADFPLQRDSSKCIKCMRCVAICEKVQHCAVWDFTGVGPSTKIIVRDNLPIADAGCALCGQCITHCPTGALVARDDVSLIMEAILDPAVETVVQVAPAVRTAWGEGLGLSREEEIDGLDIHEHGLASAYAGFSISDANSAAMVPNENTDLGEDDVTKASTKQVDAAVPVVREPAVIHDGIYDTGMHKVSIIAKLAKFDQLKTALNDLGVTGMTVTQVMGCGIQKGTTEKYRGVPVDSTLLPKIKVEVIVSKISVDAVVDAAKKALYTGHIGDGKIFVYNVTRVVKIRTGEEDFAALQDVE